MPTPQETRRYRERAARTLSELGVVLTPHERETLEITDLGLGDFEAEGLALVVYVRTDRYCAKELVMLPGQTCPQHRHPPVGAGPGKMETFRCRAGKVHLCIPGESTEGRTAVPPPGSADHYTVFHEIVLEPGAQFTLSPDTWHWFQAGPEGAVVSEFSSTDRDETDVFLDPRVTRVAGTDCD